MRRANACSSIAMTALAGCGHRRIGAELRPGARSEGPRGAADGDKTNPVRAWNDSTELIGPDPNHHPWTELELAVVGDEGRLTSERNVDLLLVRIERLCAVFVV